LIKAKKILANAIKLLSSIKKIVFVNVLIPTHTFPKVENVSLVQALEMVLDSHLQTINHVSVMLTLATMPQLINANVPQIKS
jgi:hypothetical protein